MPELPTGTITFLFTDVEGSTRLWETHPSAMRAVMARHDALLTEAFERHDGVVVRPRGEGDSLFAVFVRASDAVAAALDGQRALLGEDWGEIAPPQVRMGLHTGEAGLREGDYYGSAVNRCARIRAAGHGGQILLSEATAKLVRGTLPDSATLLDLGRHRLRDLNESEQLFQANAPDQAYTFPPLKTLDARPNNLPLQLSSFIGRERELAELANLLKTARLLTLTGPGGTGKTRLALQVAADLVDQFADGVFFVDLAPLTEPGAVPSVVTRALSVQEQPGTPLRETLRFVLRGKHLLLLLDNYEHLLDAAEFAAFVLQTGPAVTLLVTSRTPLRLRGEREYPLSPLPLPAGDESGPAALAGNPAVQLFMARAQDARPDFTLTDENAGTLAAICARLDGLPLAIELAAARVRSLAPETLLGRLSQRLSLLTGGARDAPARQQTLRDTIAWSYALLEPAEQRLFRRLGVFAGGCSLELAEAVCADHQTPVGAVRERPVAVEPRSPASANLEPPNGAPVPADPARTVEVKVSDGRAALWPPLPVIPKEAILDGISALVEKSLVRRSIIPGGEARYRMLETIREFALEQLEGSGEAEAVRQGLAVHILPLARQGTAANDWTRLDAELENARAVLGWCVDQAELAVGVRLLWALEGYLFYHGGLKELEAWRQRLLALPEAAQPSISRARLLTQHRTEFVAGSETDQYAAELEEAISLSRELDDRTCLAYALRNLAFLRLNQGRYDEVDPLAAEAFPLLLAAGRTDLAVITRGHRINVAIARGELATAAALLTANRTLARTTGVAQLRLQEAALAEARSDVAEERRFLEEAVHRLEVEQGARNPVRLAALVRLAWAALRQGDSRAAVTACATSLAVQRRQGPSRQLPAVLSVLALAGERGGLLLLSARLLAAIAAGKLQPNLSSVEMIHLHAEQAAAAVRVRAMLSEEAFAAEWAAGEALSPEAAIDLGLAVAAELAGKHDPPTEARTDSRTA